MESDKSTNQTKPNKYYSISIANGFLFNGRKNIAAYTQNKRIQTCFRVYVCVHLIVLEYVWEVKADAFVVGKKCSVQMFAHKH